MSAHTHTHTLNMNILICGSIMQSLLKSQKRQISANWGLWVVAWGAQEMVVPCCVGKGQIPWWAFFGSNLVCWSQAKQRSKKYLPSGLFIRPTQTVITIYLVLRHFQKEIWVNLGVVLHTAVLVHSGHCERHSYTQGFWSWWGARKTYSHHCYGNNHVMKTTTWVRQSCSLGWSVQLFGGDGSGAGPGTMGRV